MLDDQERTVLEETARALARNDPGLARRMRRGGRGRGQRVAVTAVTLVLVVGLLWLGLPGQALLVVMVGLGVLLALGWRPARRLRAVLRGDQDTPHS
jgi:non-ribosomal peptide synthetase component F